MVVDEQVDDVCFAEESLNKDPLSCIFSKNCPKYHWVYGIDDSKNHLKLILLFFK